MLDPNSAKPPPPDLEYRFVKESVDGKQIHGSHFFELGEVIQEDIAAASAIKTRRLIADPRDPLIRLWETLHKMILKKLGKRYDPEARPLSLLLYYQSNPFWQQLGPLVDEKKADIQSALVASCFDHIWVFDMTRPQLLCGFARSALPSIRQGLKPLDE